MSRGKSGGPSLLEMIGLVIALLAIWSLAMGKPVWEWIH